MASISIAVALAVIIGWIYDIGFLKSVLPGYECMKTNSAVCFLLSGVFLLLRTRKDDNYAPLCAAVVLLLISLSAATLAEHVFNINLHIDEALIKDSAGRLSGISAPGRMAVATAFCFLLLGLGFFLLRSQNRRSQMIAQYAFHATTALSLLAVMGYIFHVPHFYKLYFFTSMALHTSVLMAATSIVATTFLPQHGFARLFVGKGIGNEMARRLFPIMTLIVVLFGFLRIQSHRLAIVSVEFGIALYGVSFIFLSLILIDRTAAKLNSIDRKRAKAEDDLRKMNLGLEAKVEERSKELIESNKRNKIFIQEAPNAIAMFDKDMRYIAASQQWLIDYHLQDRDIIGRSHYEIFPEIGDDWKAIHQQCLNGSINRNNDAYFLRGDGTEQWLEWDVRPWHSSEGVIGGLLMYTADITLRKKTEQKLSISEEQFRGAFEYSATGIAIVSLEGNWVRVNNAVCNILGYTSEELMTMSFQDITHNEDLNPDLNLVEELIAGKRTFYTLEKRYIHKDGHVIWAILAVSMVRDSTGKPLHFISQITDISEQKIAQKALESTLNKLESLLDASTQVSIIGTTTDGIITTFNKGAENLLGYNKEQMLFRESPATFHLAGEIEQRGEELSEQLQKKVAGFDVFVEMAKAQRFETREWTYVKKDGTTFPVQLTVTAVKENGIIVGYLGIAADISAIKRIENEIKSLLDVASDQNARLKNFAHIVSHNLKSHSGNISILIDLLIADHPELKDNEIVQGLLTASKNLNDTISHLNEVVLMNTTVQDNIKPLNLKKHVDTAIQNVYALARNNEVEIITEVNDEVTVLGVEAYIDSIILNFITNAIKYSSPERKSYLRITSSVSLSGVALTFEDNGIGMDLKKVQQKLFGMYKTFHGNSDARGIGLFITKNQIEALGGKIEVHSIENQGTTFKIYLKNEEN